MSRATASLTTFTCDACQKYDTVAGPLGEANEIIEARGWWTNTLILDKPVDLCAECLAKAKAFVHIEDEATEPAMDGPEGYTPDQIPVIGENRALTEKSCCCFADGTTDDNCCQPCHQGNHDGCEGPLPL